MCCFSFLAYPVMPWVYFLSFLFFDSLCVCPFLGLYKAVAHGTAANQEAQPHHPSIIIMLACFHFTAVYTQILCSLFSTMLGSATAFSRARQRDVKETLSGTGGTGGGNLLGYGGVSCFSAGLAWPPCHCFSLPGKENFQLTVDLSQQKKLVSVHLVLCNAFWLVAYIHMLAV